MFKKRIVLLGAGFLLISGLLGACSAAELEGVESQLGIVATDADVTASFSLEPAEPDAPAAESGYMEYIHPLGYLLNGKSWAEPADIAPADLLVWYALHERDRNGVDIAQFQAEGENGYRFPQQSVEDAVAEYFGPMTDSLRADGIFDAASGEYVIPTQLPDFSRSIFMTKIEEQGTLRKLYFSVTVGQAKQDYLLTLIDEDGSIRYRSLTGPSGETGTPALIAAPSSDTSADSVPEGTGSAEGFGTGDAAEEESPAS